VLVHIEFRAVVERHCPLGGALCAKADVAREVSANNAAPLADCMNRRLENIVTSLRSRPHNIVRTHTCG
jgi:hypothetical protein